jgi:hypothetical protein
MLETSNALYDAHGLLLNYFYPSQKLITKTRYGSKYKKIYNQPKTPAARLLENPAVDESTKTLLRARLSSLDPLALARQVDALSELFLSILVHEDSSMIKP